METAGALVWIPCDNHVWKQARVVQQVSDNQVEVQVVRDGEDGQDEGPGQLEVVDVRHVSQLAGMLRSRIMQLAKVVYSSTARMH